MACPGNQHSANCIGTLSFPIDLLDYVVIYAPAMTKYALPQLSVDRYTFCLAIAECRREGRPSKG